MNSDRVSVIIPTFNSGATIERCLYSLSKQDYLNIELIVVDDASTDDTLKKVSKFGPILISKSENLGAGHSRNLGVGSASSEIVIFIDSDVIVPLTGVSSVVRALSQKKDIVAVSGVYSKNTRDLNFISDYKNLELAYRSLLEPDYLRYFASYFLAMKKSIFQDAGGFSTKFLGANVEDIEFGHRLTGGKSIVFFDKNIKIVHLKRYGFRSMLKTDFNRIIGIRRIIRGAQNGDKLSIEIPLFHIFNLFLPGSIILFTAIGVIFNLPWLIPFPIILFLINNLGLMAFLVKERGVIFSLKSLFILFIEYIVVDFSIFISFFMTKNAKTFPK